MKKIIFIGTTIAVLLAFYIRARAGVARLIEIKTLAAAIPADTDQNRLLKLLADEITEGR